MKKWTIFTLLFAMSACVADVESDQPLDEDAGIEQADCSLPCETYGHCAPSPPPEECGGDELWMGCHAGSVEDCEQSEACAQHGLCCFWPEREGACNSCGKC
jgi:hypothetical protein